MIGAILSPTTSHIRNLVLTVDGDLDFVYFPGLATDGLSYGVGFHTVWSLCPQETQENKASYFITLEVHCLTEKYFCISKSVWMNKREHRYIYQREWCQHKSVRTCDIYCDSHLWKTICHASWLNYGKNLDLEDIGVKGQPASEWQRGDGTTGNKSSIMHWKLAIQQWARDWVLSLIQGAFWREEKWSYVKK